MAASGWPTRVSGFGLAVQPARAGEEAGPPGHVHGGEDERYPDPHRRRDAAGQGGTDRGDAGQVDERDGQAGGEPLRRAGAAGRHRGQAGQAGDQADRDQGRRGGRGQVAEAGRLRVLADDHPPPAAVVEVLRDEGADAGARPVGDAEVGGEPDLAAARPDAVVQVPVLGAEHPLVPAAGLLDRLAVVDAEVDAVHRAGPAAGVERGRAHAGLGGHGPGHGPAEGGDAVGGHHPADVGRAGLGQRRDRGREVAGRQQRVPVHPGDDGVPGRADGGVQGRRDLAGRVGDHGQPRLGGGQVPRDLLGPVGRRADREHELELTRVVLAEHVPHGLREVPFLVPDRHHDGYRWVFHDAGHGTAASVTGGALPGWLIARSPPASR